MVRNNAKIDANDVKTWTAFNDTTGLIEDVAVDPTTGALLIYADVSTSDTATTLNTAKIDANDVKTLMAYNETTGLVESLRCSPTGDLLIILQ